MRGIFRVILLTAATTASLAIVLFLVLSCSTTGDPLSGPSAVDAVMAGCVYLNPVYATPTKKIYNSQHPYLAESVGEPYVCSFEQKVSTTLHQIIKGG